MSEQKGIKESLEVVKGLELVGVTVAEVMADGKLNAQDLDEAELIQLGAATFQAIKNIRAASKK